MTWLKRLGAGRPLAALQIEVTSRCNLKCVMCPVTVLADHWPARDMAWQTFERVAAAFPRAEWVHLQGWGEPLLHRRFFDMVGHAKRAGCKVGFTTNATRLTAQAGQRLLDLDLDLMAVSIAGATPATHASVRVGSDLGRLAENLRRFLRLRAAGRRRAPKVEIFYLMTPANLAELPLAVELAAELGADELVATNLDYVMTRGLDALRAYSESPPPPAFRRALEDAATAARRTGIAFRPYRLEFREMAVCDLNPLRIVYVSGDGSVSPCVYTALAGLPSLPRVFEGRPAEVPAVSFGNVNERPLAEIWEDAAYREFRGCFSRRIAGAGLALLGAAGDPADQETPPPQACRTCPKLYGV